MIEFFKRSFKLAARNINSFNRDQQRFAILHQIASYQTGENNTVEKKENISRNLIIVYVIQYM